MAQTVLDVQPPRRVNGRCALATQMLATVLDRSGGRPMARRLLRRCALELIAGGHKYLSNHVERTGAGIVSLHWSVFGRDASAASAGVEATSGIGLCDKRRLNRDSCPFALNPNK